MTLSELYRRAAAIKAASGYTITACAAIAYAAEEAAGTETFVDVIWAKAHRLFCDYFKPEGLKPIAAWWGNDRAGHEERVMALLLMAEIAEDIEK